MPQRGRYRGRGGAAHKAPVKQTKPAKHVAKPSVKEFPESLTIKVESVDVPEVLRKALPEFSSVQPYWSALEKLAPEYAASPSLHTACWTGFPSQSIQNFAVDEESRFYGDADVSGATLPVFIKRIHLLDTVRAMEGDYIWPREGSLPAPSELWKMALAKINDPLNEAYVDALFALCADRMVSHKISPHWLRCVGTFSARVDRYLYDITDEYDTMKAEPWWKRNQRAGLFKLVKPDFTEDDEAAFFTTGLSEIQTDDFEAIDEDLGQDSGNDDVTELDPILAAEAPIQLRPPELRMKRLNLTPEDGSSACSSDCDSESEIQQFVEFRDFPVQVTLLERAEGTLDELLDDEDEEDPTLVTTKEERWNAWLFQVIAALTVAQHYYGFVHNDLHTNNIMWTGTDQTHIFYRVIKGKTSYIVKVPTYGRLLKIIDFGRATYTLPEPAGFFIGDAFRPGGDAAYQYNCEPYYDPKEDRLEPNPSFDLARLSVSLLEALFPERPASLVPTKIMSREGAKLYTETVSSVYNMLWAWLIDDGGKNVLRTADGKERYPDFDLYRALASDVHGAVPKDWIEKPLFQRYKVMQKSDQPVDETIYDLNI